MTARGDHGATAVYVFARGGTAWSQQAYVKVSNPDARACSRWPRAACSASRRSACSETHTPCVPIRGFPCDEPDRANELVRSGHDRAIGANVAFGLGAAAAAAAGVLWLTGAPESQRRIAISPVASPEQLGFTAIARF